MRYLMPLLVLVVVLVPPAAADEDAAPGTGGQPCEPVVVQLNPNFSTFPPTVNPQVWIRPECL